MKLLLPLLTLVAASGAAFAQDAPAPVAAPVAPPVTVPTTPIFKDVPPNHWAFAAVQRIASAGIVNGYPSTAQPTTQVLAKVAPASPAVAMKVAPQVQSKKSTKAPAKTATKAVANVAAQKSN